MTDPTGRPVQPAVTEEANTEEITAPAASAAPAVSNTPHDLATPDGPTVSEETVTATSSPGGTSDGDVDLDDVEIVDGSADEEDFDEEEDDEDEDETEHVIATGSPTGEPEYRMALVSSVTVDLPSQHPTVLLRESESPRRQLSFSIGLQDGIVLSHAIRRIPTPRPLTHELLTNVLQRFDIDVVAVRLVGRQGAIYFAELDLRGRTGRSVLSARPSDALTLALLQPVPVPILIDGRLFDTAGDVAPPT